MKKILRICHKFLSGFDGYDLDVQDLIKGFNREYKSYVTHFLPVGGIPAYCQKNDLVKRGDWWYHKPTGAYIMPLEYPAIINCHDAIFSRTGSKLMAARLMPLVKEMRPDIVHIHGTTIPSFYSVGKKIREANIPLVVTHHGGRVNQAWEGQKTGILFRKAVSHQRFPLIAPVLAVSGYGWDSFLLKKNVAVVVPIPPGLDSFGPISLPVPLLSKGFTLERGDDLFFFPARFHPQKNQLRTVIAFLQNAKENPHHKLIMSGRVANPSYFQKIMDLLSLDSLGKQVILYPELDHKTVLKVMHASDAVLLPTINEGLGRSAIEAIMAGSPVLAGKDSGYEEIVEDGKTGLLVNPFSLEEIRRGMVDVRGIVPTVLERNHHDYLDDVRRMYHAVSG
jgi:glycosyltransferase involved in cell wall biosynthesis